MIWVRMLLLMSALCGGSTLVAADRLGDNLQHVEAELKHVAASDPDHAPSGSDPLSIDPDLAVWTLIVFVLLFAVLWKFAWGPIVAGLEKREHSIAHDLSEAKKAHEEAKSLLGEYEAKLTGAAETVRGILDEARKDAEHTKQEILAEAKSAAEAERLRSLRDIELATDAAIKTLAEKSADLAVQLAGKIVRTNLTSTDHARLVQEAVDKFPSAANHN